MAHWDEASQSWTAIEFNGGTTDAGAALGDCELTTGATSIAEEWGAPADLEQPTAAALGGHQSGRRNIKGWIKRGSKPQYGKLEAEQSAATADDEPVAADASSSTAHALIAPGVGRYRADVDGLRAVAVTAVILYHLDHESMPGGFTGVDIFFVISGYVVLRSSAALMMTMPSSQPSARAVVFSLFRFLLGFYARRVQRLVPSLVLMVVGAAWAVSAFLPPFTRQLRTYYTTGQFALIGWSNNYFAAQTSSDGEQRRINYFEERITDEAALSLNPFTHTSRSHGY